MEAQKIYQDYLFEAVNALIAREDLPQGMDLGEIKMHCIDDHQYISFFYPDVPFIFTTPAALVLAGLIKSRKYLASKKWPLYKRILQDIQTVAPILKVRRPEAPEESFFDYCPQCDDGGGGRLWTVAAMKEQKVLAVGLWCEECEAWSETKGGVWTAANLGSNYPDSIESDDFDLIVDPSARPQKGERDMSAGEIAKLLAAELRKISEFGTVTASYAGSIIAKPKLGGDLINWSNQ